MPDYFEAERIFADLSGMSVGEAGQLKELILISYYSILGQRKENADEKWGKEILNRLIAVDAWYRYLLALESNEEVNEIRMLDVSISRTGDSGRLRRVKELREELRKEAGPWLTDRAFVFQKM